MLRVISTRRCTPAGFKLTKLFGIDDFLAANDFWKVFIIYGLLTKREVKMAGYWPSSFFACLWTETKSRSINTQKKNEANILPS